MSSDEDEANDTVHLDEPGPDLGQFSTLEVRPRSSASQIALTSRTIAFPSGNYTSPPNIAAGFSMLDLATSHPLEHTVSSSQSSIATNETDDSNAATDAYQTATAVRANLVGSHITADSFHIGLETWGGGIMRAASATWIEHAAGARECHFGQIDTMDDDDMPNFSQRMNKAGRECVRKIRFPKDFTEAPAVVCWINRLDLGAGKDLRYRLSTSCSDVSSKGATVRVGGWGDRSLVHGAGMCWIAFPPNKRYVDWGRFTTNDSDSTSQSRSAATTSTTAAAGPHKLSRASPSSSSPSPGTRRGRLQRRRGRVRFRSDWFTYPPTVLAALDMLDMDGGQDLRVAVKIEEITKDGFSWRIDTWGDSKLHAIGSSWIALGFD